MFVFNISFMTVRALEARLLEWLRRHTAAISRQLASGAVSPCIRFVEVAEVESDPEYTREALNLSVQLDFSTLAEARAWGKENMPILREELSEAFGEQVMAFATILAPREQL